MLSLEHQQAAAKARWAKPEQHEIMSKRLLGNKHLLGHKHSASTKTKMSIRRKGVTKSESHAQKLRRHLANLQQPTSIELILGLRLRKEYPRRKIVPEYPFGFFRYDFAIPGLKLFFEADGEYWHRTVAQKRRDASKNAYAANRGWKVIRYTGTELKEWARNASS